MHACMHVLQTQPFFAGELKVELVSFNYQLNMAHMICDISHGPYDIDGAYDIHHMIYGI